MSTLILDIDFKELNKSSLPLVLKTGKLLREANKREDPNVAASEIFKGYDDDEIFQFLDIDGDDDKSYGAVSSLFLLVVGLKVIYEGDRVNWKASIDDDRVPRHMEMIKAIFGLESLRRDGVISIHSYDPFSTPSERTGTLEGVPESLNDDGNTLKLPENQDESEDIIRRLNALL